MNGHYYFARTFPCPRRLGRAVSCHAAMETRRCTHARELFQFFEYSQSHVAGPSTALAHVTPIGGSTDICVPLSVKVDPSSYLGVSFADSSSPQMISRGHDAEAPVAILAIACIPTRRREEKG
ncbi:hypothetical protein EVAR_89040_1 [Eumeta japonica]|uniref:Uncharacterized protein n=1 Tax=Eumeta variegata TaxID=151549 RepID=A0A4C1Z3U9_EUMVA|nr:hypothetical protein EVAR_89040_1 [Eumeta japonica]